MKRYFIDAAIMAVVFIVGVLGLEVFHTWQRVNAMWGWVNEQNARMQQIQQPQKPSAPEVVPTPSKP